MKRIKTTAIIRVCNDQKLPTDFDAEATVSEYVCNDVKLKNVPPIFEKVRWATALSEGTQMVSTTMNLSFNCIGRRKCLCTPQGRTRTFLNCRHIGRNSSRWTILWENRNMLLKRKRNKATPKHYLRSGYFLATKQDVTIVSTDRHYFIQYSYLTQLPELIALFEADFQPHVVLSVFLLC